MNDDTFDQILHDWIREGPERGRVEALDRALAATHRTAQRPGWRQPSWPAQRFATLAMAVTAVVVIAVIGFGVGPRSGGPGGPSVDRAGLGANSQVQQVWTTDEAVAVTIQRQDPTDRGRYYWRAVAYDQMDLNGWTQTNATTIDRQPDTQLFEGLADAIDPAGLHSFTFTVTPGAFLGPTILSPGTPVEVDAATRLTYVGQTGFFAMLELDNASGSYTVTALTQPPVGAPGQLTQAELRVAGTGYPQEVKDLYLQVAPGSIGPNARRLEDKVRAEAASSAPFDLASRIVAELHSSTYTYATDVRDLDCATLSTAECFATYKRGFCQHYATTMAVLLRDLGVPTRIVEGFLPGTVDGDSGTETIPLSGAHTWVEVYFPGHGWVMFDPTGGNRSQVEPLPPR
jgi:Transglutaminase-like superfamily/TgpA N-terminal domain